VTTLEAERAESQRLAGVSEAKGGALWAVVRDPRVLALTLVYVGSSAGLYVLGLWSPLILNQFGYSAMTIGWLNSAPSFVAVVCMILWARHSDRTLERAWHVAIPCFVAFVGFLWAGEAQSGLAVIVALMLVNIGVNGTKGPVWAMPSLFLTGAGAAAGIALINAAGNLGGFVGPWLIGLLKDRWGSYAPGLYMMGWMCAMAAVVVVMLGRRMEKAERG
jgi:ACS family tartrate transporter-like MFS transporter